jgi:hypothetical protein
VISSSNDAATVMDVRKAGESAALYTRTLALTGKLNCATDQIDQDGVCVLFGQMSRDIEAPSVLQEVVFKIELWWEGVKSVLWTFSDRATTLAKDIGEKLSTSFATQGETTVTAIYKDVNGNELGSKSVKVQVGAAQVAITATITAVQNDNVSPVTAIPNNTSTTDTTPKITGSISAALGAADALRVYAGTTLLGTATTTGTNWVLTDGTALTAAAHTLKAVVYNAYSMTEGSNTNTWIITVTGSTIPTSKLPHTGINASQCYSAGNDTLMTCSGVANDLNAQQDGHRANINAMSYSQVGSFPITSCVKDNLTGLIWEGKTASGTRAGSNTYSNYQVGYLGTQAQMDAATNTFGYVAAVNAMALCGFTDWRMPTVDELQSIVDYSKPSPGPMINTTWFPNTANDSTLTSSHDLINHQYQSAWFVPFYSGVVSNGGDRRSFNHVRLVRSSQ